MAYRFYLLPIIGTGATKADARRPKYIEALGVNYAAADYGNEALMMVAADVTPAQHAGIAANADVIAAPANLNAALTGQDRAAFQALEANFLPADGLSGLTTWQEATKYLFNLCHAHAALAARAGGLFKNGVTLNSPVTPALAAAVANVASQRGINPTGNTMRALLNSMAQEFQKQPLQLFSDLSV